MAFLTRSDLINPFAARLLMSAELLEPELNHAIVLVARQAPPAVCRTTAVRYSVITTVAKIDRNLIRSTMTKNESSG